MTAEAAEAAIGSAREQGRRLDQLPDDLAMPTDGWAYDRLNPAAPLEGLERAVARRAAQCATVAAAGKGAPLLWCDGPGAERLAGIAKQAAETSDVRLQRELRGGLRGERYDLAKERLGARGALMGELTDAEAAALYLWSGDNKARPIPDGTFPFQVIGGVMRGLAHGRADARFGSVAAIIAGTWRALGKLPEPNVPVLYRGFRESALPAEIKRDFMKAHRTPGAVFQINSFTSYTTQIEVAKRFAGEAGWVVILERPKQVRDITVYSALPSGREHLAPPLRQYRVTEVSVAKREIRMTEIDNNNRAVLPTTQNFAAPSPDDVIEVSPGRFVLREYAENPEWMAWSDEQSRLLDEVRNSPSKLTKEEQEGLDLVVAHMLYGA